MAASFAPTPLVTTSATFWACLGYLRAQGVSDIAAVRPGDLRAFLTDDERLDRDPARPPKKHQTPPDVLALAELERLLAAPARGDILERHLVGKPECDLAPPDLPAGDRAAKRGSSCSTRRTPRSTASSPSPGVS